MHNKSTHSSFNYVNETQYNYCSVDSIIVVTLEKLKLSFFCHLKVNVDRVHLIMFSGSAIYYSSQTTQLLEAL